MTQIFKKMKSKKCIKNKKKKKEVIFNLQFMVIRIDFDTSRQVSILVCGTAVCTEGNIW